MFSRVLFFQLLNIQFYILSIMEKHPICQNKFQSILFLVLFLFIFSAPTHALSDHFFLVAGELPKNYSEHEELLSIVNRALL